MIIKSLRIRTLIFTMLVGILPTLFLLQGFIFVYRTIGINSNGKELIATASLFSNEITTSGYLAENNSTTTDLSTRLSAVAEAYNGRVMLLNDSLSVVQDSYRVDTGKTVVWTNCLRAVKGESLHYYDDKTANLIVTVPIISMDNSSDDGADKVAGVMLITRSMDYMENNIARLKEYFRLVAIVMSVLIIAFAIYHTVRLVAPVRELDESLSSIIAGHSYRVDGKFALREISEIADKTNIVVDRLKAIDESRQEFVSNVSHELKTPLTSMKVLADSINGAEDVPVEMYKEFMLDIGAEIDRETGIINDLLSLVRMDKSGAKLNIEAVNINELIESVLKRIKPIAAEKEVELVFESFRPVVADIDEVKFTLALTNLIENGVKYNNDGGWVHVSLNADARFAYIKVEDNGMGIDEESLSHVFDRFYRADKSHSTDIPGTGLGLAITKSAVLLHKGEIKVHSELNEGTVFDVRIPLIYISEQETTDEKK